MKKITLIFIILFTTISYNAQVTVDNTSMSVEQYVQNVLAGTGVTIFNVEFNGSQAAAQIPNEQVGSFNDVNSDVGLSNGVIMGSGDVSMAAQLNTGGGSNLGGPGTQGVDLDLAGITTNQIWDEAVIEFDFVPQGDTISFNYVFASEEYEEYVCGTVNDAFGFFLTGNNPLGGTYNAQNIALIPNPLAPGTYTTTPVSINSVNPGVAGAFGTLPTCTAIDPNFATYNIFYSANTANTYEYDGNTVVLQARAYVNCGDTLHIKLAIGDGGDPSFDSGVFLEAGSFSSEIIQVNVVSATGDSTIIEGCADATINFTRPDTIGSFTVHFDIGGNAIMDSLGVVDPDYAQIADSVLFLPGFDTASITITPYADLLNEVQDTIIITVTTIDPCGNNIISTGTIYILDVPNMLTATNDTTLLCPLTTIPISVVASNALDPYSYVWTDSGGNPIGTNNDSLIVSGLVTDTFYVSTTDACNLVTIDDTIIVTVNSPVVSITTNADTTLYCPNHQISLIAGPSDGITPYTYNWIPGGPGSTINDTPSQNTTYYVTATDACGNTITDSVVATISYTPFSLNISDDVIFPCPNLAYPLGVVATPAGGTGPYTYDWGTISSDTDSIINVTINAAQPISVIGTDFCGFNANNSMNVSYATYTPMIVTPEMVDSTCANENVNLSAFATNGVGPYNYSWSHGGTGSPVQYFSSTIGENIVTVTVTDECNLQESSDVIVNIINCKVDLVNVITPNGDNQNDFLTFKGIINFPNNRLTVINRWGTTIFETNNYQNDWNGGDASEGTYFYILELNNTAKTTQKGTFTLLK
ncbi:MAG: choice-of-anchor L domain-containing protein [Vicingaceae bacterium]|nr:choice-of-anchor L domain-containing protein [Vicingaceae bacterium]